jgi:hypothetical protein
MRVREIACIAIILLASAAVPAEEPPTAQEIIDRMIDTAGGREEFRRLGLLFLKFDEEETTSDGQAHKTTTKAYVSTTELDTFRLEMQPALILGRAGSKGWAVFQGQLDIRPQTPTMAKGTIHNKLFPALLPFALAMAEINVMGAREGKFDNQDAYRIDLTFPPNFFASPVMNSVWSVFAAKKDYKFLAASFQPPKSLAEAESEGIRYRYLKHTNIGTVRLPSQILMEGLFANGLENGHVRIINLKAEVRGWDATLFLDPEELEALDEQEDLHEFIP